MWRNREQFWYIALSMLIVSLIIATLTLLGTRVVRVQSILGNFEQTKKLSSLSAETNVNVLNVHLRVKCPKIFLMNKQFCFFLTLWPMDIYFWVHAKIISRCIWSCLLFWKVFFKAKVCLCPYIEKKWWNLFRMFAVQNVLQLFQNFFYRPKIDNYAVWWWWHILFRNKDQLC